MCALLRRSNADKAIKLIRNSRGGPDIAKIENAIERLLGDGDVEGLHRVLKEGPPYGGVAARALGELGDPAAVPCLLEEFESSCRPDIVLALGMLQDERGIEPIVGDLNVLHSEPALIAIGQRHRQAVIDAVSPLLSNRNGFVRTKAVAVLRGLAGPDLIPVFKRLLESDDINDRIPAMNALNAIGTPEAEQAVKEARDAGRL
jgi:HEAT repeat protein